MSTGPLKTVHRRIRSKADIDVFVAEIVKCGDIHTARNIVCDLMLALSHFDADREIRMNRKRRRIAAMSYIDVATSEEAIERRMRRSKLIDKNLKPL